MITILIAAVAFILGFAIGSAANDFRRDAEQAERMKKTMM